MTITFLILAAMTLGGAGAAFVLRRLVHCALLLVFSFGGLAGLYLQLGAQFVGFVQILIYVGAVSILVVFTILLTRGEGLESGALFGVSRGPGLVTGGALAAALIWGVAGSRSLPGPAPAAVSPSVRDIGDHLMTNYVPPLEVMGVLLTAALIGAVIVALPEGRKK